MKKFAIEFVQCVILTTLVFGPLFYYFILQMKP